MPEKLSAAALRKIKLRKEVLLRDSVTRVWGYVRDNAGSLDSERAVREITEILGDAVELTESALSRSVKSATATDIAKVAREETATLQAMISASGLVSIACVSCNCGVLGATKRAIVFCRSCLKKGHNK